MDNTKHPLHSTISKGAASVTSCDRCPAPQTDWGKTSSPIFNPTQRGNTKLIILLSQLWMVNIDLSKYNSKGLFYLSFLMGGIMLAYWDMKPLKSSVHSRVVAARSVMDLRSVGCSTALTYSVICERHLKHGLNADAILYMNRLAGWRTHWSHCVAHRRWRDVHCCIPTCLKHTKNCFWVKWIVFICT